MSIKILGFHHAGILVTDLERACRFYEEVLGLKSLRRPDFDFGWSSQMEWKVRVNNRRKVWTCEVRIPLAALNDRPPTVGTRWRANLYRIDRANRAFLASNPVLSGSFHTPERFGWLEFTE